MENHNLTIIDKEYLSWVKDLALRYRQSQIKAAVKVNREQIRFNFLLGKDLVELHAEERWGQRVLTQLSIDIRKELPGVEGFSKSNLYYCKKFYLLYNEVDIFFHQVGGKIEESPSTDFFHQLGGIFQIPWKHHCLILDKVKNDRSKALFYVRKTAEYGWSRAM
ncbi:MAG: DUF1016 N-terminal domain-containing protein, partial [Bacteroidales bacterium]|nr:DUF1016 N-terminal domain-containing protein [Bacteroidales bacterium]